MPYKTSPFVPQGRKLIYNGSPCGYEIGVGLPHWYVGGAEKCLKPGLEPGGQVHPPKVQISWESKSGKLQFLCKNYTRT